MQSYEGYFENGRFYAVGRQAAYHIEGRRRAIITILDEPAKEEVRLEAEHAKAWREFFEAVNSSDEEIPDTFEKVNFKREIEL